MIKSKIMKSKWLIPLAAFLLIGGMLLGAGIGLAAYNHMGDTDSVNFRTVYPADIGTKLDSCTLCHSGGSYVSGGKTTTLGSCQWCHYKTNYGADTSEATLLLTLNPYGVAYKDNGRSAAALTAVASLDSDGDSYTNQAEINATTYPGDPKDNPSKVAAPSIVLTRDKVEQMPQHSQLLLMNASKSTDTYASYSGVTLENLIKAAMLDSATGITVYSPDGFATFHPFNPSANPNSYHIFGTYPSSVYYYNPQADVTINPSTGWADYSAPSCAGRNNGDPIVNAQGLKTLLAIQRDGQYLAPGVLNLQNKLDGEGPFRVVPPQKNPGPPDQRSTASDATNPAKWVWPYIASADHNAGFSSRTVTMIKVEPLPAGTTDINTLEAGWPYVDENKIIVYGAITSNPLEKLSSDLDSLIATIQSSDSSAFKNKGSKTVLSVEVGLAKKLVAKGAEIEASLENPSHNPKVDEVKAKLAKAAYGEALKIMRNNVLQRTDGFVLNGSIDKDDWVVNGELQQQLYSAIQRIWVLMAIVE